MTRLLLAFLALISGLALPSGAASARMSGTSEVEVGSTELPRSPGRAISATARSVAGPAIEREQREQQAMRLKPSRTRVYIPSVQLHADRALE